MTPEEFVHQYARFATIGEIWPRTEGSLLLEFATPQFALLLLDRSGPYLPVGAAKMLLHGLIDTATPATPATAYAKATGRSSLRGSGPVVLLTRRHLVVSTGAGFVILTPPAGTKPQQLTSEGSWLEWQSAPLMQGFFIAKHQPKQAPA